LGSPPGRILKRGCSAGSGPNVMGPLDQGICYFVGL